jgi:hypothetical protein
MPVVGQAVFQGFANVDNGRFEVTGVGVGNALVGLTGVCV